LQEEYDRSSPCKTEINRQTMNQKKRIVMLGTSADAWGGIAAVINAYRESGLFDRFPVTYLTTHSTGRSLQKLRLAVCAWTSFVCLLVRGRALLVHAHAASGASFWRKACFLLPAFLFRVPTVLHIHAGPFPDFYLNECNPLARAFVRALLNRVDRVVVVSNRLKVFVESISAGHNVVTIYNPMPLPPLPDFAARAPAQVLFLGRLGRGKGTWDLLQAVRQVAVRHPGIRLVLGGDGELEQARETSRALGIEAHVELPGWVGARAKAQLLAGATVCVLPSYSEGMPMSVLEAMSAGLAVIATPVGGIPEVLTDGVEGRLVPPGDVDALAAALDHVLSDAQERRRMGMAGRARAENVFASARVVPLVENLYRQLGATAPGLAANCI
jgi:glycosyltransferase involved in cell wall biosynthesis